MLLLASARIHGRWSRGVGLTAAAFVIWAGADVALLLGLPDVAFWAGIRPLMIVLFALSTGTNPGVARSGREWLGVLFDGWLMVGGVFGLAWIVVESQTVFPDRAGLNPLMLWLVAQIALMCSVGGLFAQSRPGSRQSALATYFVGLIILVGDVLALVTGDSRLGIPFWLGGGLLMAGSVLVSGDELLAEHRVDPDEPRRIAIWQLPLPFAVCYVLVPVHRDLVLQVTTVAVAVGLFLHLALSFRSNGRLWARLLERTRVFEELLRDSQDVILRVDDLGVVEFANPAAVWVLGREPSALLGRRLWDLVQSDDRSVALRALRSGDWSQQASIRLESRFAVQAPIRDGEPPDDPSEQPPDPPDAEWRHIEWTISRRRVTPDGEMSGWIMSGRNVSERIALERQLVTAARMDTLTGLLNRGAFLVQLGQRLIGGPAAVLFIDLDEFKTVNDTLGHGQGDEYLRQAAACLRQAVGARDVVARLGGDEFAVLLDSAHPGEARTVAEAVVSAFSEFDVTAQGRPSISASIGVAAGEAVTAIELLRDADLAMYRAKQNGGAGLVEFEPWMSERVMEKSRLRANLEIAVRTEALSLYLQPVVDLHTRQWTGFEALVRWPVGAQTWSPAQFLPVAEESGLIVPMGAWVLGEALRQLAGWRDDTIGMAVNVAAQQLVGTELFDITMRALEASGISPDRLTLEITEQTAIQDLGRTASRLEALRSEGVHIAIDDFGTGFSSLQYLSRLPVDILKIDRKFVWGLGQHPEDDVLVRSMLGLAAELGLDVIAEGVETSQQAELLLEYGCRLAQGFLFSPPRPIEELRSGDHSLSPPPSPPRPRGADQVKQAAVGAGDRPPPGH